MTDDEVRYLRSAVDNAPRVLGEWYGDAIACILMDHCSADVPDANILELACRINHDASRSAASTVADDSPDLMNALPLRRLVLRVVEPGSVFTVQGVVEKLADLGVSRPANQVSNALGYFVPRGLLERVSKGVYRSIEGGAAS
jgi:hypothetical protein